MSKTILFVHGAWVTPQCWDSLRGFFEENGFTVVAPAWPYMDRPVKELRDNPDSRLVDVTVKALVDHFEKHIRALPDPPILIGHSFGGLIVQLLLDRGLGVAGVAIDAGPPRGVLPSPRAVLSAAPVLLAWRGWQRILTMSFESFSKTFANTVPASQQRAAYDQHIVPAPGRIYFQAALGIGVKVNFSNPMRPPILLLAASEDKTSTTSMVRSMYRKHLQAPSRTDIQEFTGRSHWLIAEKGWDEIARFILAWTNRVVTAPAETKITTAA